MTTTAGRLIVLEGPDAAGKSSLVESVAVKLKEGNGAPVDVLSFPGRTSGTLGAHVYELHHDAQRFGITRLPAISLQLLHVAAHLDAIEADIRPRVHAGHIVLLDRYWWSTWVYGSVGGVEPDALELMIELERRHWGNLLPDPAILIRRSTPLRSDTSPDLFKSLIAKYDALALREQAHHRVVIVDNDDTLDSATATIIRALMK